MAAPQSAGVLLFRHGEDGLEVLLIRPGGPFWRKRDAGAWMIPKGRIEPGEAAADAALREFTEETGAVIDCRPFPLCRVRQAGGKWVEAFAAEGDCDAAEITSNEFEMEWPPRSGRMQRYLEAEEARWMPIGEARRLMLPSQLPMLDALEERVGA